MGEHEQKKLDFRQAALAQLKLARCPDSLAASLAALPSMSLIPIRSIRRNRSGFEGMQLIDWGRISIF
jgi:hypothetical protein